MNIDTGKIVQISDDFAKQNPDLMKRMVEINEAEMTAKQRATGQVSLHDRRSPLGRQLTKVRRKIHRPWKKK